VCMNEVEAYYCYKRLREMLKTYYIGNNLGIHAALRLADKVLKAVDPQFRAALFRKAKIERRGSITTLRDFHQTYSFTHMNSLALHSVALEEAIELWDLYFAIGPHVHIVAYVAELILMRTKLMDKDTKLEDYLLVRRKIDARAIANMTMFFLPKIDQALMNELKDHGVDKGLCEELIKWVSDAKPGTSDEKSAKNKEEQEKKKKDDKKTNGKQQKQPNGCSSHEPPPEKGGGEDNGAGKPFRLLQVVGIAAIPVLILLVLLVATLWE